MRRLPVYFLIDVSESMVGAPIQEVQDGMRTIIQELRGDPYALETAYVSIIVFAGKAKVLTPLTELYQFYPPAFPIGGGTALGRGLDALMDDIDKNVSKTTIESKGDWKPIVYLFTDGTPTDDYHTAFKRWNDKYRRRCNLVAVSIGNNLNTGILGKITDNVLVLKRTDAKSFSQFFKWITASIKSTSMSVSDCNTDEVQLPSTSGINLEKVDPKASVTVDENYAVLLSKCQNTRKPYLVKFARKLGNIEDIEHLLSQDFNLIGSYPIDEERYGELSDGKSAKYINTSRLHGFPNCPCCGNPVGVVVCECGGIFCAGERPDVVCPWCGMDGKLTTEGGGNMDINRTIG